MLKPPGTKHLKLISDEPLSNFGFKFKLRRYTLASSSIKDVGVESGRVIRTATLIIVLFTVGSGRYCSCSPPHRTTRE